MMQFKKINRILGFLVFLIALAVYSLTMEQTGSLWDCGEFLSGASKLQVVHPPGAPLFLMVGRLFMLLSFGDATKAAMMVNFMSALSTALCTLFFFWSLTILMKNMFLKTVEDYTTEKITAVLGSAVVASLGATFLDSMWFSAVEGEVYALSVFFMALNLWAALKWYESEDEHSDRWLLFIAFSTGLSLGVHLLSLLVFPVIGVIFYYKKFKTSISVKGALVAFVCSFIFMGIIMKFIISGIPQFMGSLELLFVNSFGLPFYSGAITALFLIVGGLAFLTIASAKNRNLLWWKESTFKISLNTLVLFFAFIIIGFSSYVMVIVRANANPPINMNRPIDPMSLLSYINREQYGDRPLLFGPDYSATQYDLEAVNPKGKMYKLNAETKKYEEVGDKMDYTWKTGTTQFLPRLGFWQEERFKSAFRVWLNPSFDVVDRGNGNAVMQHFEAGQQEQAEQYAQSLNKDGQPRFAVKDHITQKENFSFLLNYQFGFMYMRYFFWNFVGRTTDQQATYFNADQGRWVSGTFLDNMLGSFWGHSPLSQSDKPETLKSNRANNHFYFIPLILALIGLYYHYKKDKFNFSIVLVLVFVTGAMQVLFHNQPPIEPRERDYVFAPSFWAFTFWMGFGVYAIYEFLKRKGLNGMSAPAVAILLSLSAPALMGFVGWDDHDRSHRTTTRDFAVNMLESCGKNAILFTYGDNDTYPLWYAQEVEGVRLDVRVVNLSLLGVDWYIEQLRYKVNESAPLKLTIAQDKLNGQRRDMTRFMSNQYENQRIEIHKVLEFIGSDDNQNKIMVGGNNLENYVPTRQLYLDVDSAKTVANAIVPTDKYAAIPKQMTWDINGNLMKNDLVTLDIVANNMFDRPICFAISSSPEAFVGLDNYMQMEGMIYRVVPVAGNNPSDRGSKYTEKMYDLIMNKFKWGGMESHPILMDENTLRGVYNMKNAFVALAFEYVQRGEKAKAVEVLDKMRKVMPRYNVPVDQFEVNIPMVLYAAGATDKAKAWSKELTDAAKAELKWMCSQSKGTVNMGDNDLRSNFYILNQMATLAEQNGDKATADALKKDMEAFQKQLM